MKVQGVGLRQRRLNPCKVERRDVDRVDIRLVGHDIRAVLRERNVCDHVDCHELAGEHLV